MEANCALVSTYYQLCKGKNSFYINFTKKFFMNHPTFKNVLEWNMRVPEHAFMYVLTNAQLASVNDDFPEMC